ncbi:MAG: hypothetical protein GDA43_25450, partial [Hormoscilla sp. SP5CHS1]|nr:hypothetical protein [Hormoscilla sp. SP5CHS1]
MPSIFRHCSNSLTTPNIGRLVCSTNYYSECRVISDRPIGRDIPRKQTLPLPLSYLFIQESLNNTIKDIRFNKKKPIITRDLTNTQIYQINNIKFKLPIKAIDTFFWLHEQKNVSMGSASELLIAYSLFRKQVEHFCAKLELYSMQTQFSYGTLLSG